MTTQYKQAINNICNRLNHVISPIDIIAWLDNFEEKDKEKALIVLQHFEYFTTDDIVKEFDRGLRAILASLGRKQKMALLPVGKIGKSGAAMIYYLKKTLTHKNSKRVLIIEKDDIASIPANSILVLVDDFAGTGKSIEDFYNNISPRLPSIHSKMLSQLLS